MPENREYTQLTLEGLRTEEKKIKKQEIISAAAIGFLTGIIVYGVAKDGFGFLYTVIPLVLMYGIYKNSQKQKEALLQIRAEISARNRK